MTLCCTLSTRTSLQLCFPGPWHCKDPKIFFHKTCIACSSSVYHGGPLVGVARKILVTGTKFNQTSMAGPLGRAAGSSVSGHSLVEQDVDG
jgi:hypothetical protein